MRGELAEFPVHQGLRGRAQSFHQRAGELHGRMVPDPDDEIAHFDTLRARQIRLIPTGHGQSAPHGLKLRDRAGRIGTRLQHLPDDGKILRTDFGLRRDTGQSGARLPQSGLVLEAPCGLKVIRVIGGLALVEVHDPLDRILFAIRLDQHGVRSEVEPIGRKDHAIPHFARRLQVLIQQRRRHGQRFAGVVETRRVGGIHGELPRGADVHASQVPDGVVVFRVAQPARQHGPRIARILPRLIRAHGLDPIDHLLADFRRRLRKLLGRHLFRRKLLEDACPSGMILNYGRHGGVSPEIELGRGRIAAMASDAILRDKRLNGLPELPSKDRIGSAGGRYDGNRERGEKGAKLH